MGAGTAFAAANTGCVERVEAERIVSGEPSVAVELLLRLDGLVVQNAQLAAHNASLTERVEELERRARRSSRTSHVPPSSDGPGVPRRPSKPPSERSRGGQPGHPGSYRALCAAPDTTVEVAPTACAGCGGLLDEDAVVGVGGRHQVWEIPAPRALVTEYRLQRCRCTRCGAATTATLPLGVPTGMFGPNLEAAIIGLSLSERVSRRRVCEVVAELCGVQVALGTIDRILARAADAFAPAVAAIDDELHRAACRSVDETSWRVAGRRSWAWAATTRRAVRFRLLNSRGRDSCHALLGEHPTGVITTDRWAVYNHLPLNQRQICWAHLARDFRAQAEKPGRVGQIATRLVATTSRMCIAWKQHRGDRVVLAATLEPVRAALEHDLDLLAQCGEDSAAAEFALNLIILDNALWTFVANQAVEPTNNAVERALRPIVIHRKTSYGTQTDHGSSVYEALQSIVQTLRHQHRDVYAWLRDALQAAHHQQPLPAIISG